ncbi:uncharacterized protein LOC100645487 isoform X1 [Bombus terrestris]|uniref:Uncharacterized protein LOC100645487 isoform X1 n=1 Tax=Bombus terrestris TaxID=30195 RepID=A0A9B0F2K5_BOMTE|nr:uncharacterized protein LOC100645487 isoform X1 [Bombus terrestris]
MYPRYGLLLVFAYHVVTGLSLPTTTYDQRQTGDLNVQVHLKDVQVVALLDPEMLDDYTEYDYFYDYADFTLKPIVKPTTSTTTTTETVPSEQINVSETPDSSSQNSTFSSISETNTNSTAENAEILLPVDAEKTNETLASSSTGSLENSTSDGDILRMMLSDKIKNLFEDKKEDPTRHDNWGSSTENPSKRLSRKRCKLGYSPDGRGRCRRLSQRKLSLIPLTMRLPSKLFDDLRRNTRNLAQEEDDRMHLN